jgi:hypothetical protein
MKVGSQLGRAWLTVRARLSSALRSPQSARAGVTPPEGWRRNARCSRFQPMGSLNTASPYLAHPAATEDRRGIGRDRDLVGRMSPGTSTTHRNVTSMAARSS